MSSAWRLKVQRCFGFRCCLWKGGGGPQTDVGKRPLLVAYEQYEKGTEARCFFFLKGFPDSIPIVIMKFVSKCLLLAIASLEKVDKS